MLLMEFLYEARNAELGVIVATDNPERLRQKLYKVIKENPQFTGLSLLTSPRNPTGELWIVKNAANS